MLVLSRKVGEKVVIGGNITVTITRVAGNRVTLGIDAPVSVRVVRGELAATPSADAPAAAESAPPSDGIQLQNLACRSGIDGPSPLLSTVS